jgi:hypothetical protein
MLPDPWSNLRMYLIDLPLLIVLVSLTYSATRYEKWSSIFLETFRWMGQLIFFLGGIALLLYAVSRF